MPTPKKTKTKRPANAGKDSRSKRDRRPSSPTTATTTAPATLTAARREAKRNAILEAALALFASRGFHGTAVPLIAEQAGIAAGTIYTYFVSKEALVNELYRFWKGTFLAHLSDEFPVHAPPRAQFAHLWRALAAFQAEAPQAFDFLELHFHAPYLDQASLALEDTVLAFCRRFFAQAQAAGAVKPLAPDLAIALVFGAFVNLVKQRSLGRVAAAPATLKDSENALWDALRK